MRNTENSYTLHVIALRLLNSNDSVGAAATTEDAAAPVLFASCLQTRLLLDAVDFVYRASAGMGQASPTFQQRLAYLRTRLPQVVIGATDESL